MQQSTDSNTHGNRVTVPAKFSLLLLFYLLSGIEKTSQLKHIFYMRSRIFISHMKLPKNTTETLSFIVLVEVRKRCCSHSWRLLQGFTILSLHGDATPRIHTKQYLEMRKGVFNPLDFYNAIWTASLIGLY